jgi:flavin-dependent dehydrogenase
VTPTHRGAYDVAVAGAGPAGLAAAIACAARGLRVALFESDPFPRRRAGETLHPGIEPVLESLGAARQVLEAGFLRHEGSWVERNGESHFEAFGSGWLGFQAPRDRFDAILLDRAIAAGVEVRQPCRIRAPLLCGRRVSGIVSAAGPVSARYVLDATGSKRWLARALGIPLRQESPRLFAQYGYLRGRCPGRDAAPRFSLLDRGWVWTARVQPGRYHFTRLAIDRPPERGYLPAEFTGLDPDGEPQVVDVTWRIAQHCAGPGYFLLGDAAALLDPSSSHGVLRAMLSGMLAAHWIRKVIYDDISEKLSAIEYDRWVRRFFHHDASALRARLGWS